jgi:hypothetical protein
MMDRAIISLRNRISWKQTPNIQHLLSLKGIFAGVVQPASNLVIQAENLGKEYRIGERKSCLTLRDALIRFRRSSARLLGEAAVPAWC